MRNFISFMFAAMSLFAMSCETKINTPEEVRFEITSEDVVTIGAEGGMVNITYTLTGGTGVYSDIQACISE